MGAIMVSSDPHLGDRMRQTLFFLRNPSEIIASYRSASISIGSWKLKTGLREEVRNASNPLDKIGKILELRRIDRYSGFQALERFVGELAGPNPPNMDGDYRKSMLVQSIELLVKDAPLIARRDRLVAMDALSIASRAADADITGVRFAEHSKADIAAKWFGEFSKLETSWWFGKTRAYIAAEHARHDHDHANGHEPLRAFAEDKVHQLRGSTAFLRLAAA